MNLTRGSQKGLSLDIFAYILSSLTFWAKKNITGFSSRLALASVIEKVHAVCLFTLPDTAGHLTCWISLSLSSLNQKNLCTMGPQLLDQDMKDCWCEESSENLNFMQFDWNSLVRRIVTGDETWINHYNPKTKEQSMQWKHASSPSCRKFKDRHQLER